MLQTLPWLAVQDSCAHNHSTAIHWIHRDFFRKLMRALIPNQEISRTQTEKKRNKEKKPLFRLLIQHPGARQRDNTGALYPARDPWGVCCSFRVLVLMFRPARKTKQSYQSWTNQKFRTFHCRHDWFFSSACQATSLVHYAHFIEKLRMEKLCRSPSSWPVAALVRTLRKTLKRLAVTTLFLRESIPNSEFPLPRAMKGSAHSND